MAVSEQIRAIETVLDDPRVASDSELIDALVELERVQALLVLRAAAVVRECDSRFLCTTEGCVSTGAWLAEKCDQRRSTSGGRVRQARNLAHMPVTVAAAEAGDLSKAKVELLARARKDRLADEFDRMEPTLVAEAKRLSADGLARLLKRWEHVARDAVQSEPDSDPHGDERPSEIHLSQTFGGRWALSGDLTAEDGAILASGITHTTDALFHAGAATADGVLLTPSQRRGRATVEVFRRGITADPEQPGAHPLILALVDYDRLVAPAPSWPAADAEVTAIAENRPGRRTPNEPAMTPSAVTDPSTRPPPYPSPTRASTEPLSADHSTTSLDASGIAGVSDPIDPRESLAPGLGRLGLCEIDGAGPVSTATIQRLTCDGAIRRVVVDTRSEVLDVGRARRLATPAQRAALRVRDRGCVFPGCDRPSEWCQAHHLVPFEDGGATDLDNLCLLCSHHHHLVHEGGWSLERIGITWVATTPAGVRRTEVRGHPDALPAETA